MSQNEMRDMSHVTGCAVSHKYSFDMIEHLLSKNMRYIAKKISCLIISQSSILPLLANQITVRQA
jgi:hypothetical protein